MSDLHDLHLRLALEGRLELLEAALPRFVLLADLLRTHAQPTSLLEVARELSLLEPKLVEALATTRNRLQHQPSALGSSSMQLLAALDTIRSELAAQLGATSLADGLHRLEAALLTRHRPTAELVRAALAALPCTDPHLQRLANLEPLLTRACQPAQPSRPSLDLLAPHWDQLRDDLELLAARLANIDPTGPLQQVDDLDTLGTLNRTRRLHRLLVARLHAFAAHHLQPLQPQDHEAFPLARWLLGSPLELAPPRDSLAELARLLAALRSGQSVDLSSMLQAAQRADAAADDPDHLRLLGALNDVIAHRARARAGETRPLYRRYQPREPRPRATTLAEAVRTLAAR